MSHDLKLERRGTSTALTPLLDMLFLLLFTLLATSQSAESLDSELPEEEIAIELPSVQESQGTGERASEPLVLFVDASGGVTLAGAAIPTPAELRSSLEARVDAGEEVSLELNVDGDARHAVVADVLQAVRAAGVSDLRFLAHRAEESASEFGAKGAPR